MIPGSDHSLRIRGRSITYRIFGDPAGRTVIYLHGFPSSRLEAGLHHELAATAGIRLVAFDRPGYGRSDRYRGSVGEIGYDAVEVADALRADRFDLVGVSGGGPYATACAALAPDRVGAMALLAPLGPPEAPRYGMRPANRAFLAFAGTFRRTFAALQPIAAYAVRRHGEGVIQLLSKSLPELEVEMLRDDALRSAFTEIVREAFVQRGAGATADGLRLTQPWNVDMTTVRAPVRVWHGLVDDIVPPGMGGYYASCIPDASLTVLPSDGHFSLVCNHMPDVFAWLTTDTRVVVGDRRYP